MPVKIRIPTPLQKITKNQAEVLAQGTNVKEILGDLDRQFPGLKERLYDEKGSLRRFINFYVNNEDIRFLKGETTAIKEGDEISIVPAIAGGTTDLKFSSAAHEKYIESLLDRIRTYYSHDLVSLAVFGSYARGENRFDSDLDLLIILEKTSERIRIKRLESFVREVELPLNPLSSACYREGVFVEVSPLILIQKEGEAFLPIYLDMVDHCLILTDRDSFLKKRLEYVRRQMNRWGSRRKEIGGHWYWEIRPGTRWNEVIDYDK